jgi:uncharacterized membrane protein
MENLAKAGRCFYGSGMVGLGIQQFIDSDFRPVIMPPEPLWLHFNHIGAYITGIIMIVVGALIIINKNKSAWLFLGGMLLLFFLAFHVTYLLFINVNSPRHLGLWTDPLKELTLSGGAFVMTGAFTDKLSATQKNNLVRIGSIFLSITLIAFGLDHFYYTDFVATLVPSWIPGHIFWTYFAAVALIGAGVGILLKIKTKTVALLLGTMIFLWFIVLHIPRAITAAYATDKGNEMTSVFESLAFSGIAFVIAYFKK